MSKLSDLSKSGIGTRAIHAGQPPEPVTGAVMTPVFQTSTYAQPAPFELDRPFPDIVLPALGGAEPMSIADFRGQKVVLQVFASW